MLTASQSPDGNSSKRGARLSTLPRADRKTKSSIGLNRLWSGERVDKSGGDAVMHTRGQIKHEMMTCGYRQEECGILGYGTYRVPTRVVCLWVPRVPPPASAMTLLLQPSLGTHTRESKVLSISLYLSQSRLSGAARCGGQLRGPLRTQPRSRVLTRGPLNLEKTKVACSLLAVNMAGSSYVISGSR